MVSNTRKPAYLLLENGMRFDGYSFGADRNTSGELVFQTGMVGYVESLTDPSYKMQILVLTYPLIGNYGVPNAATDQFGLEKNFESDRIHASSLIVGEACDEYSHWDACKSLTEWLVENNVPGICGIDTRNLTKILRENGSMLAKVVCNECDVGFMSEKFFNPNLINLVDLVSVKKTKILNPNGRFKIAAIDFGAKNNQFRMLCTLGACVHVLPWNHPFSIDDYDGLFLSNGPSDPTLCKESIENLKKWINDVKCVKPVFGICYGHQILALAAGFRTYKMKYGNRGFNQPCTLFGTKKCLMSAQNHGYSVAYDPTTPLDTLNKEVTDSWDILFYNENDNSNEGIVHKTQPYFSVQFHPEHMAGPTDSEFLFNIFMESVAAYKNKEKYELKSAIYKNFTDSEPNRLVHPTCFRPKKVLLLGSGGLSIGQAGEFDYSGSQAIKAFKEENIFVVLINPNIATIQTSKGLADKAYFLPITTEYVIQVIKAERPDAISLSFGGQTALNCGIQLHKMGVFDEYNVKVLGTTVESIMMTEDRQEFAMKMESIGEKVAPCEAAYTLEQAIEAGDRLGYPVLIRAAFALGGLGSGFAYNRDELIQISNSAFALTNQILIDKSLKGWKEVEYEVVRDNYDNCITVCNMENIDPLGIHTGESIVIAPSQTLSNREYNMLRTTALKVIRSVGVVGECNIQYALDPNSLEYYIIEVNARLSRSSALASKATGYPLAYIAAKLSLGLSLVDIKNSVTRTTTACFEPSLDYCVVKIPRWDLKKFVRVSNKIGSSMKSVGEVMAIGRGFEEAFQKALRMIDDRIMGFDPYYETYASREQYEDELKAPTDKRIFVLAAAIKSKLFTIDNLYDLTRIDKWFLNKFVNIIDYVKLLETDYRLKPDFDIVQPNGTTLDHLNEQIVRTVKQLGFSDKQIALYVNTSELEIRRIRLQLAITPFVKQIDTVAAEYPANTNYLYLTYNGVAHDVAFEPGYVIVLGSGVYRIGSSVEFDWCCVTCLNELRKLGNKTIMINFNPETVSTDYDMSDKLYFEELSFETVMSIYDLERPKGVILSMGGQIANNIALNLHRQKVKVLGSSPVSIDNAENRFKFSRLLDNIGIMQPQWKELQNSQSAIEFCEQVGYPCLVRPSYVLSGAAMKVAYNNHDLLAYLRAACEVSIEHPVVISKFILDAKEIDVDAVAQDGKLLCLAVSSHVENAGVHSGDATLITPPIDINEETLERIRKITSGIASALQVNGPFNLQLIAKDNQLKVIECNLRVSRSFPFVSKVLDYDFIAVATQVAMGLHPPAVDCTGGVGRIGVKVPQFSFSRLTGSDVLLGVEMVSTGEVACFGENKYEAYLKALMSTGFRVPKKNILLSIGSYKEKTYLLSSIKTLEELGYNLYASRGTADFYSEHNIKIEAVDWHYEDQSPMEPIVTSTKEIIKTTNDIYKLDDADTYLSTTAEQQRTVADYLMSNHFDLIINIPMKSTATLRASSFMTQGYHTRRMAINYSVPLITNSKNVKLLVSSLRCCSARSPVFKPSIDCLDTMKYIRLPGLIDVHVHLREPGGEHKEDVYTGTCAALAGGYTMVLAMPNTNPPLVDEASMDKIDKLYTEKAVCDYGLYCGATADNAVHASSALVGRACGLKMYLNETFNALKLDKMDDWLMHFQHWPHNLPICCHAEEQSMAAILFLCELYDRHVHICHVSTKADMYLIKMAKEKGLKVTCEVAPHHLFLTDHIGQYHLGCTKEVRPRLKAEEDRKALWDNMDVIDMIASDHAPHTLDEKQKLFSPGFPGLETTLALMITAYKQGKLSMDTIVQKCYTNPKRIFNLPDQPNTFIEVDIDTEWTVPKAMPYSKCQWTPFAGMKVYGIVKRVTFHGEVVFVDGKVLSKPGSGKNIASLRLSDASGGQKATTEHPSQAHKSLNKTVKLPSQSKLTIPSTSIAQQSNSDTAATTANESARHKRTRSSCSFTNECTTPEPSTSMMQLHADAYMTSEPMDGSMQLLSNISQILTRPNGFYGTNIISVDLFKKEQLHELFNVAHHLRTLVSTDKDLTGYLRGKIMAEMFYEPSTRTQCSFAAAMQRLGGSIIYMDEKHSSVKKGETLDDSVRMMSSYSDCIVIRHPEPGAAALATRYANVPVLNAGDGTGEHPTQALLDVFTIREEIGTVNGITITMVGDLKHGRTVHSLAKLLRLYRVKIQYVSPDALRMPTEIIDYLNKYNIVQQEYSTLEEALPSTDVLYMTRIQKERFETAQDYDRLAGLYVVTPQIMRKAKKKMIVMHPLPRVDEISVKFDTDPRAAYFRQAEYGMYVRMGLLLMILKH